MYGKVGRKSNRIKSKQTKLRGAHSRQINEGKKKIQKKRKYRQDRCSIVCIVSYRIANPLSYSPPFPSETFISPRYSLPPPSPRALPSAVNSILMLKQPAYNLPHRHTAKQPLIRMPSVHCYRGASFDPVHAIGARTMLWLLRHICWGLRVWFLALVVVVGDEGFDLF